MATKITIADVANAIHFVEAPEEAVVVEWVNTPNDEENRSHDPSQVCHN